jgi:hypothetical protein
MLIIILCAEDVIQNLLLQMKNKEDYHKSGDLFFIKRAATFKNQTNHNPLIIRAMKTTKNAKNEIC